MNISRRLHCRRCGWPADLLFGGRCFWCEWEVAP